MTASASSTTRRAGTLPGGRQFILLLCTALAVVALILRALDHVPGWLLGEPRTVEVFATLDAMESRLRVRLLLPAFFPDTLAWPPADVRLGSGASQPTAVTLLDRARQRPRLIVCQTLRSEGAIPERLLPPLRPAASRELDVGGYRARLVHGALDDGSRWLDLAWGQSGRTIVLRFAGDERELLRIASSLSRGHR